MTTSLAMNMKKNCLQAVTYLLCFLIVFLPFVWEIQPVYAGETGEKKSEEKRIPEQTSVSATDNGQTSTQSVKKPVDQVADSAELQKQVMDIMLNSTISTIDQKLRFSNNGDHGKTELPSYHTSNETEQLGEKEQIRDIILAALSAMFQTWKSSASMQPTTQNAPLGHLPSTDFELLSQKYGLPKISEEVLVEYENQVESDLARIRQAFEESKKLINGASLSLLATSPLVKNNQLKLAYKTCNLEMIFEKKVDYLNSEQMKTRLFRLTQFLSALIMFENELFFQCASDPVFWEYKLSDIHSAAKMFSTSNPNFHQDSEIVFNRLTPIHIAQIFSDIFNNSQFSNDNTKWGQIFTCPWFYRTLITSIHIIASALVGKFSNACSWGPGMVVVMMETIGQIFVFHQAWIIVSVCIWRCMDTDACFRTLVQWMVALEVGVISSIIAVEIYCSRTNAWP